MKLLLAGNWQYEWYEAACAEALRRLVVEIIPFCFASFFRGYGGWGYLGKVENALPVVPGPALIRLVTDTTLSVRSFGLRILAAFG
jgi:hypothetical protein